MTREEFEMTAPRDREGRTALHRCYCNARMRCYNAGKDSYARRRGIEFNFNSWPAFRDWSLEAGWAPGLSIDRIDNSGNYEPANCRWISIAAQQRNRTNNKLITIGRTTKCLAEWLEIFDLSRGCYYARLYRGWDELTALTEPPRSRTA